MAYGIIHFFAGGTQEQYDATLAAVHTEAGSLPKGQIFHAAGASEGGWTIVAVHDSRESWEAFRDGTLLPRLGQGIEGGRAPDCRNGCPARRHTDPVGSTRIVDVPRAPAVGFGPRRGTRAPTSPASRAEATPMRPEVSERPGALTRWTSVKFGRILEVRRGCE